MIYHIGQRVTVNDNFGRREGLFLGTVAGYDMCHNKLRLDRPNGVVNDEEAVQMLSEGWRLLQVFVEMDDPTLWASTWRQKHPAIHCSRVSPAEVKK